MRKMEGYANLQSEAARLRQYYELKKQITVTDSKEYERKCKQLADRLGI